MKPKFVFLFLMLSALFSFSFGQIQPDKTQLSALHGLNTKYNNMIKIDWDKKNGSPEVISLSNPVSFDKNQENSANIFIKEIAGLIKHRVKKDTLVIIKRNENKGIKYFRYQQKYFGIPVKGGEYVVTVLNDGKIQTALGSFYKDISIDTKPNISPSEALSITLKNPPKGIELKSSYKSCELIVYPQKDIYYLAYELHIKTLRNDETWCYIIDAFTGKILEQYSRTIYSQAYAYLRHPGLDASYSTISPVANLSNNGYIQGTYAYILNDEGDEAYNANNDFRYATDNTHFDEANLYYHIDRFRSNYLNNLGFNSFTQITAHAHYDFYDQGQPSPNASYDPDDHHLRFSDGQGVSGFYSFAREDKIIYHEYTHAVTDYVADLSYGYTESGAVHEGNSDYFAASFTGRYLIGDYACSSYQRDITDPIISTYSGYQARQDYPNVEPHDGGELWSACLWDLRSNLTASVADEIIYDALYAIPTTSTFLQYREAILKADVNDYGGSHLNTIAYVFYSRGIGNNVQTVSGTLQSNQTWTQYVQLSGNVSVPSGVTLTIASTAVVNLLNGANSYYINSTGGTITVYTGASINGLKAYLYSGYTLKGLYQSIQTAVNNWATGQTVKIPSGEFNENFSVSGKNGIIIQGQGPLSTTISGTISISNSDDSDFLDLKVNNGSLTLNNCSTANVSGVEFVQGDYPFLAYNSSGFFFVDAANSSYIGDDACYYNLTSGDMDEVLIRRHEIGVDAVNYSYLTITSSTFCNNDYDLVADNSSTIYAYGGYASANPAPISGQYITWGGYTACSLPKTTVIVNNNNDKDPGYEEFNKIGRQYSELMNRVKVEKKVKGKVDLKAYVNDYNNIINGLKNFMQENASSVFAGSSVVLTSHMYKQLRDYDGLKTYLTSIAGNKKFENITGIAKRLLMDYYNYQNEFNSALTLADEIIKENISNNELIGDVLFAKGLVYENSLNNKDEAKKIYTELVTNYADNSIYKMAKQQLRNLGIEVEEKRGKEISVDESKTLTFETSNYPNPFNPTTTISYTLPEDGKVQIKIFDVLGREVATLMDGFDSKGNHSIVWNGSNVSSGIYFYSISFKNQTMNKKMLLMK